MTTAPKTPPSPMTVNAVAIRFSAGLEHKTCGHCKKSKPKSDFHTDRCRPDGLDHRCKICRCEMRKTAYWKNPEKARAYSSAQAKKHYPKMKAKIMARVKAYVAKHPEKYRVWKRKYMLNGGRKRATEMQKRRREGSGYDAKWRAEHRAELRSKARRFTAEARPWYVRGIIVARSPLKADKLPECLVRAKQQNLKLKRTIWNLQKT